MSASRTITKCRSCDAEKPKVFLDLGQMPLTGRFIPKNMRGNPEMSFPLKVAFCHSCSLVQITETVDPEILFADDYPYYSSFSPALLDHSKKNVSARLADRNLDPGSLVVELASNDGYLLKYYVEAGIPVLGIDPAAGPAAEARKIGVPTEVEFFTKIFADKLVGDGIKADVIHANNVLAHVADTHDFIAGIKTILKEDGVLVVEVPYLLNLMERVEFDTVYHEHLCYFSVTALVALFRHHGLYLNHIEKLKIHGGSLRLFVEKSERIQPSVTTALQEEKRIGMDKFPYYETFSTRVNALKQKLVSLIETAKSEGKSVAAYGAAAKGVILLNYCDLDRRHIDFVVDRNVHKQGQYLPGLDIPVLPPEALTDRQPDYAVILAWNFSDGIMRQQKNYTESGGRFIIPVPAPKFADVV